MADLLMFRKTSLTGGGATAVDGISATALVGEELCWATVSDTEYLYRMNATSGAAADGINIILPVVGTVGNKRWILQSKKVGSGTVTTDHIAESTAAHGVDVDGVGLKDGDVNGTIGAATPKTGTFTTLKATTGELPVIHPASDSTTAIQINKADKTTNVVTVDTTNGRVGIGTTGPGAKLDVAGAAIIGTSGTSGNVLNVTNTIGTYTLNSYTLSAPSTFIINSGGAGYLQLSDGIATLKLNGSGVTSITGGNVGIGKTDPTSTLHTNGSVAAAIVSKTADYTATASDYTIICDATSASFTITLPAASGCSGRIYNIKKIDSTANTVTIDANSTETIDGALTQVLSAQWESLTIQSSGTGWYIL